MKVELSLRYGVIGIYKDRDLPIVRVYPLPFVRISFGDDNLRESDRT